MILEQILNNCAVEQVWGKTDINVLSLCYDSRRASLGSAFFALRGHHEDGHRFLRNAIQQGAKAVFVEKDIEALESDVTCVLVRNSRKALAKAAQAFYGDPTRELPTIGITGTNGKTTITYLLESIFARAGKKPAVIGTINYRYGDQVFPAPHTTPESIELMAQMESFKKAGARSFIMEVSSHALNQHRADGVHFQVGVFTNLTPEHLDYHQDMESYFQSKLRLFQELLPESNGKAVVNIDDPYGRRMVNMLPDAITCGKSSKADVRFERLHVSLNGIEGQVVTPCGSFSLSSPLLGEYNVENLLCAIGAAVAQEVDLDAIAGGLAGCPGVPGRLEPVANNRNAVILVDYAHTGDALRRVLEAMQALGPQRILTVFGCGGDRDRTKRPVMAEEAARNSSITIVTSDNPRTEDPGQIIKDVRQGMNKVFPREWSLEEAETAEGRGYVVIPDRREAIRFAVSLLMTGDLLLVAGKGHEDYQILGEKRVHFDDRQELRLALEAREQA